MLTETTAEIACALTLAAARRVAEADVFMRAGKYEGWLPTLFVGQLLQNKTVGIIGAGRIGAAYARMMVEGHKMDLVYFDPYPNEKLEKYVADYGRFLQERGERGVSVKRVETMDEVFEQADVRSSRRWMLPHDKLVSLVARSIRPHMSGLPCFGDRCTAGLV